MATDAATQSMRRCLGASKRAWKLLVKHLRPPQLRRRLRRRLKGAQPPSCLHPLR